MRGFPGPWYVAGGWALDLFLGRVTRPHEDVEVALFRQDQMQLREHLPDWEFVKVSRGRRDPWRSGEWLELPVHEIHGCQHETGTALEFLLNERQGGSWVYRRNAAVTLPLERVGGQRSDLPYLRPEIVLLYKAKSPRPIDEEDFRSVLHALDDDGARWLFGALRECHPKHHWLEALAGPTPN